MGNVFVVKKIDKLHKLHYMKNYHIHVIEFWLLFTVLESKKPKLKKRHRIRRISSGEGPLSRMRKESVSSNASEGSEDLEKGVAPVTLDEAEEVPMEEGITLRRMSPPPATPPAEPPMANPKLAEKKKQWNNMFPDLHTALAAVDLNATKPASVDMNGAKPKAG